MEHRLAVQHFAEEWRRRGLFACREFTVDKELSTRRPDVLIISPRKNMYAVELQTSKSNKTKYLVEKTADYIRWGMLPVWISVAHDGAEAEYNPEDPVQKWIMDFNEGTLAVYQSMFLSVTLFQDMGKKIEKAGPFDLSEVWISKKNNHRGVLSCVEHI